MSTTVCVCAKHLHPSPIFVSLVSLCWKCKLLFMTNALHRETSLIFLQGILKGEYHCTIDLLFDWFGISCMTTDNFCFYLQNRLIQTSQTGGQLYNDTSPFSPWLKVRVQLLPLRHQVGSRGRWYLNNCIFDQSFNKAHLSE